MTSEAEFSSTAPRIVEGQEQSFEDVISRIKNGTISSGILSLIILLSTVAVTIGIIILVKQNDTISEQKSIIEKQKAEIEKQKTLVEQNAAQLARDVRKIPAAKGPEGAAITVAQEQAVVVQNQISSDISGTELKMAPPDPVSKTVLLTRGQLTGWDVDVFFCEGVGRNADYAIARVSADAIASASAKKQILAPGVWLGRVQIRPWPESLRDRTFKGLSVVSDRAPGEDAARDAIAKLLPKDQNREFRLVQSRGTPTKYYISVFACNGWLGS